MIARRDRYHIVRRLSVLITPAVIVCLSIAGTASAAPSEHSFEIVPGSFHITPSTTQAGAHADLTTTFDFAHAESGPEAGKTYNDLRNSVFELPAGFTGSATAVPTCPQADLLISGDESTCPPASQVGTVSVDLTYETTVPVRMKFPVFNMEVSSHGVAAELGFNALAFSQFLVIGVRPGDAGLTITVPNSTGITEPHDISVTIWGVPGAREHDAERGEVCQAEGGRTEVTCQHGGKLVSGQPKPFLSNPTACTAAPLQASMRAASWEAPQAWSEATSEIGPIVGCERLPFSPSIEAAPTTTAAESPTGLDVSLMTPQTWESPFLLSTSNLKDTTVTLPEGLTVNPSAGSGLAGCTPAQYAAETSELSLGTGCPQESKIGAIEIETPLLPETLNGAVYIAKPYENVPEFGDAEHPGGSLLALYVVAKDPQRGILIKTAGKVEANPVTGQLVTTFRNTPQQAFSSFRLKFRPGATAPLVSPPTCGSYGVQASLTPWSGPEEPHFVSSQPFAITQGVREGPCPAGGLPPFHPQAAPGTQNNAAGSYSPLYLRLTREDGEQELTGFSTVMPPGLTGNLTGIPFCSDTAIGAARSRTGKEELASPSCPAASKVGHTIVEAGVGTVLAQTPGSLYLGGPYHGAPLSLVSITSATVGPFDLGTVVIRFALRINPLTAQVEVSPTGSEPIPHIIKGIVTHVRNIRAYIDRAGFIKNPTSCEHMQIQNTVSGADGGSVSLASPFQAADCQGLAFKPTFKATVTGRNSKANGAGLKVNIAYPNVPQGSQANIHAVKVELPIQLPSRLTTLQKACLARVFEANPANCPKDSLIGYAKAVTPILPVPLVGPAYFVSHGGEAFPSLIIVLQGYGVTIDLVGTTFISKKGITSSTFKAVPDQPVTSFELTLPQGPFSALGTNKNLCALTKTVRTRKTVKIRVKGKMKTVRRKTTKQVAESLIMPTEMTAQNGAVLKQATKVRVIGCPPTRPSARPKAAKTKHKRGKRRH